MTQFENNSIFWIEVDKIRPNPFQPRREFDEMKLEALADSIRQYGVLQPIVVTRYETQKEEGGLSVGYELIAGERRMRASKLAGLDQIPATIRTADQSDRMKLELAIIENLQREDLNPIDKARAFYQLVNDFGFKHVEIGKKMGKSREFVSNSIRLLSLPEEIQHSISRGEITEGHARPLLMLTSRPDEQNVLYREVMLKKLTVRDTESLARRVATDRVRKKEYRFSADVLELEKELTETLGTRVQIEQREVGGKVVIDFFSDEDLRALLSALRDQTNEHVQHSSGLDTTTNDLLSEELIAKATPLSLLGDKVHYESNNMPSESEVDEPKGAVTMEEAIEERRENDDGDLYSVKDFTV